MTRSPSRNTKVQTIITMARTQMTPHSFDMSRTGRMRGALIATVGALLLTACTTKPEPLSMSESASDAWQAKSEMFSDQEPLRGPLTLDDALARSILYNLDNRVALLEEATQQSQLDLLKYEMWPRLTANAGYFARNKDLISSSYSTATDTISEDETISTDKRRWVGDLTLSWNVLDFGTSYYQSKQQADKVLIARERKRRAINNIYQEVTAAYWDAVTAQRLLPRLEAVLRDARASLDTARSLEKSREMPLADALRYQRELLDLVRQLESVTDEMQIAKMKLAKLMGLPVGADYVLARVKMNWMPTIGNNVEELEIIALTNRPEVQEERYNVRIAQIETRRALVKFLPSFNPFALGAYDSNSYLKYNSWAEAGFRAGFQLINLVSLPSARKLADDQVELAKQKRLAVSMAIVAQVHVSLQQLSKARRNFDSASRIASVEQRLNELSAAGEEASVSTPMERIRARTAAIAAELERDRSYADLMNANTAVYAALGVDQLPEQPEGATVAQVSEAIRQMQNRQRNAVLSIEQTSAELTASPAGGVAALR